MTGPTGNHELWDGLDELDEEQARPRPRPGHPLAHELAAEPEPGSVAMTEGPSGTAWQLMASDGLWHSTTGHKLAWADVQLESRRREAQGRWPVLLVHLAPRRDVV